MNKSIATIKAPEFVNLQPLEINPLMSSCEIKVLYVGSNRNGSFVTKEVATEMSKTLRGAPIVGHYRAEKEDFTDHGEQMIFDDEGIRFNCLTIPYGFVAPDAKVWFQNFEDTDTFGNVTEREYLMTTGFLWTGQFEEAQSIVDDGKPQSMELDCDSLEGKWEYDNVAGREFFIINDATFSKLCVLGEGVEPCFEGASITAPTSQVSTYSAIDEEFKSTLFNMMKDLKFALEGGQTMENETKKVEEVITEEVSLKGAEVEENTIEAEVETEVTENTEVVEETIAEVEASPVEENTEFKKEDEKEEDEKYSKADEDEESKEDEEDKYSKSEDDEDEKSEEEEEEDKYSLMSTELESLKLENAKLQEENKVLVEFKNSVESEKKDELIKDFYMLSDEDKAEVISNKSNYTLEEIEAKLSVICVRKKVNFSTEENAEAKGEQPATTFTIESTGASEPAYISALKRTRDSENK